MKKVIIIFIGLLIFSVVEISAQFGHWSVVEKIDTSILYKTISCPDSMNCIACATWGFTHQEHNVFRKTIDGGNTWFTVFVDNGNAVYDKDSVWQYWKFPPAVRSIDCPTVCTCVAVHDSGYISKTTDGGYSWLRLTITIEPLYEVDMFDSLNGIATGILAGAFLNNDGGITWSKLIFPDTINTTRLEFPFFLDNNTIILTSWPKDIGDFIIRSEDRGKTWSKGNPRTGEPRFEDMKFISSDIGWAVSRKGRKFEGNDVYYDCVYFTDDGGLTWQTKLDTLTHSGGLTVIDVFDENIIMATGPYNQVWMTVDGGLNWYLQNGLYDLHRFYGIADLSFNTKTTAIAMSAGHSEIYKYSENPIHVENFEKTLDNEIIISPNPASEYIEISFEENGRRQTADDKQELDIRIFNVYGEQMTAGIQNFEPLRIDVSDLADGMYFLRCGSEVKKFIKY